MAALDLEAISQRPTERYLLPGERMPCEGVWLSVAERDALVARLTELSDAIRMLQPRVEGYLRLMKPENVGGYRAYAALWDATRTDLTAALKVAVVPAEVSQ